MKNKSVRVNHKAVSSALSIAWKLVAAAEGGDCISRRFGMYKVINRALHLFPELPSELMRCAVSREFDAYKTRAIITSSLSELQGMPHATSPNARKREYNKQPPLETKRSAWLDFPATEITTQNINRNNNSEST